MRNLIHNRVLAVGVGAVAVVGLSATSAVAGALVGSQDIRDRSIRAVDLHQGAVRSFQIANQTVQSEDVANGALGLRDLNDHTRALINQPGPAGEDGDPGLANLTTDGPYTVTWKGDAGATLQTAVVSCDIGQYAVGGGFSGAGGTDDVGTEAYRDLQVVASFPYTDEYEPINARGSFRPNQWVVKGFNNGVTDLVVRPWVTCADVPVEEAPAP